MAFDTIQSLDAQILTVVSILLFIGLAACLLGLKRLLHGKWVSGSLQSLSGSTLLFCGLFLLSIAINLYTYDRLTYEQPIAELSFQQLDKQRFQVFIEYKKNNKIEEFLINGDEWQVDARILKWHGWAQILGLDAQYRLERISGRYSNIEQERSSARTVYSLNPKDQIDYWKLANNYKTWLPWVDAYYGSAAYLPMSHNASYSLSLTQTGLIARPLDAETDQKVKFW